MSIRSSLLTKSLLASALLCAAANPAWADKKDDLYNQAVKAGSAQQLDEAARLFCEVFRLDPTYRDSKQMCTLMTSEAEREHKKNDDRYAEGVKALQEGHFDDAEQKFRNVRSGSHVDDARQQLARIPALKQEKASADVESTRFDQASQAYDRNDFATAKSLFGQISGKRQREAQVFLGNISRYEQAVAAGDSAASSNPRQAVGSYNEALAIKQDGPGDPRGKVSRLQQQMAAAASSSNPPITTTAATPPRPVESAVGTPVRPRADTVSAVKAASSQVDTGKLMREAQAAEAKGQTGLASGKYLAILAAEPGNAAARQAFDALSRSTSGKQSAGTEADVMLAKGIREFYTGMYEDAEVHIKDYLAAQGSRAALAQFYLGAIRSTRYYLGGAAEARLLADAQAAFRVARGTRGFVPPDEHVVSPKILKVFKETPL